jgi:6-phosphofructokinase 1
VASGAELAVLPEAPVTPEEVLVALRTANAQGKNHFIVVLAEGAGWKAEALCDAIRAAATGFESRPTILGHVQRGGPPTVFDRLLATRLGAAAVEALAAGEAGFVVGLASGQVARVPLADAIVRSSKVDPGFCALARALAQ